MGLTGLLLQVDGMFQEPIRTEWAPKQLRKLCSLYEEVVADYDELGTPPADLTLNTLFRELRKGWACGATSTTGDICNDYEEHPPEGAERQTALYAEIKDHVAKFASTCAPIGKQPWLQATSNALLLNNAGSTINQLQLIARESVLKHDRQGAVLMASSVLLTAFSGWFKNTFLPYTTHRDVEPVRLKRFAKFGSRFRILVAEGIVADGTTYVSRMENFTARFHASLSEQIMIGALNIQSPTACTAAAYAAFAGFWKEVLRGNQMMEHAQTSVQLVDNGLLQESGDILISRQLLIAELSSVVKAASQLVQISGAKGIDKFNDNSSHQLQQFCKIVLEG